MFPFCTPQKHQTTRHLLTLSRVAEEGNWPEMDYVYGTGDSN